VAESAVAGLARGACGARRGGWGFGARFAAGVGGAFGGAQGREQFAVAVIVEPDQL